MRISEIYCLDIRQRDETIWDGESVDRSSLRNSALPNFALKKCCNHSNYQKKTHDQYRDAKQSNKSVGGPNRWRFSKHSTSINQEKQSIMWFANYHRWIAERSKIDELPPNVQQSYSCLHGNAFHLYLNSSFVFNQYSHLFLICARVPRIRGQETR